MHHFECRGGRDLLCELVRQAEEDNEIHELLEHHLEQSHRAGHPVLRADEAYAVSVVLVGACLCELERANPQLLWLSRHFSPPTDSSHLVFPSGRGGGGGH